MFCRDQVIAELVSRKIQRPPFITGAAISAVFGILLLVQQDYQQKKALASSNWPITTGRITASYNLERVGKYTGRGDPQVLYSYTVNGKKYRGDTISFALTYDQSCRRAQELFPLHSIVKVHYSPDEPGLSCLEIGNTDFWGVPSFYAVVCFAGSLFFIFKHITYDQKAKGVI